MLNNSINVLQTTCFVLKKGYICAMISALVIASRFIQLGIESGKPVTPMKLQKLIYLAHGIHLARYGKSLIVENIEAWAYGPVVPKVYDFFKSWGNQPIVDNVEFRLSVGGHILDSNLDIFTDELDETINYAWGIAKDLSGIQLSNWSHSVGSPWEQSYTVENRNQPIDNGMIGDYFRNTMKIGYEYDQQAHPAA